MSLLSVFTAFLCLAALDNLDLKTKIHVQALPLPDAVNTNFNRDKPKGFNGIQVPPPEILRFMRRFGYLDPLSTATSSDHLDSDALYHESAIIEAIKNIQKYGDLEQTGHLNNETLELFIKNRCGVPDIEGTPYYIAALNSTTTAAATTALNQPNDQHLSVQRTKRYIIGAKPWTKRHISYFIANESHKIPSEQVERDLKRAFALWSEYSGLHFQQINSTAADITVGFGRYYHGDNYPFDGAGNILAHAFYPYEMGIQGGDIHFDEDENWIQNSSDISNGVDFYSVAAHELGHSLGLAHSMSSSSIMFPYYKGPNEIRLNDDDKTAMRKIYLNKLLDDDDQNNFVQFVYENTTIAVTTAKTQHPDTTVAPEADHSNTTESIAMQPNYEGDYETVRRQQTTPTPLINICNGDFDAVTSINGSIHIFKGEYVWRLTPFYTIAADYPKQITEMFSFLKTTDHIDAAYVRYDGMLILFTGNKYWICNGTSATADSPRMLTDLLGGSANYLVKIDAAMLWPKNNQTYIFAGSVFWRYDDETKTLENGYPKSLRRWPGIPNNINAAATLANGKTYFFKHNLYWLYNNMQLRPERGYPRRASNAWLQCPRPPKTPLLNFNTTITFISSFVSP